MMFQFTQPKRAATAVVPRLAISDQVSIHAAQADCDLLASIRVCSAIEFQFTQPKRAATLSASATFTRLVFQFTQPKRAATSSICRYTTSLGLFQFTQPKRAATQGFQHRRHNSARFNSRSPSGLRRAQGKSTMHPYLFQFTQPKRAATICGKG